MTEVSPRTQIGEALNEAAPDPLEHMAQLSASEPSRRSKINLQRLRYWGLDIAALTVAIAPFIPTIGARDLLVAAIFITLVWLWFIADKLYVARFISRRADEYRRITNAMAKAATSVVVGLYIFNIEIPRMQAVLYLGLAFLLVLAERQVVRKDFTNKRKDGTLRRRIILVGGNEEGEDLAEMFKTHRYLGYHVMAQVDPMEFADPNALTTHVLSTARQNNADSVVMAATGIATKLSNRLVRDLVEAGMHVELSSTLADISPERLTVRTLGRVPIVYIEPRRRNGWRSYAKRAFDLSVASIVVVLAAPVMFAIALLIKFTSKGPVFFAQERVGQNGEPFKVLKFRTMVTDAEAILAKLSEHNEGSGPLFKMKDDPRVTKIGGFLRKTSLDELPQLFNVLKNDMSLVGPRPALQSEMSQWDFDLYARLRVKPGITGMWQVSGRSTTTFEQYTRLDLYYVDNWSLFIDLSILLKTIPAVLKSDGAY